MEKPADKYTKVQKILCQAGILAGELPANLRKKFEISKEMLEQWQKEILQQSTSEQLETFETAKEISLVYQKYTAGVAAWEAVENILLRLRQDSANVLRRNQIFSELNSAKCADEEEKAPLHSELKTLHIIADTSLAGYLRGLQKSVGEAPKETPGKPKKVVVVTDGEPSLE